MYFYTRKIKLETIISWKIYQNELEHMNIVLEQQNLINDTDLIHIVFLKHM